MYLLVISLSVFTAAALASYVLTPLVSRLAVAWQVLDVPDLPRKRHARPVPLLGGLAIWLGCLLVVSTLVAAGVIPDEKIGGTMLLGVAVATAVLMVGGYLDDRFHLPPLLQIAAPTAAALLVVASGLRVEVITNPFGGIIHLPGALGSIITFAWLLGMMYTTKLLDGVDGLVASLTVVGALIIYGLSLTWDAPSVSTSLIALAVAGATAGFLPFNLNPARVFLGEGGSTLTGFLLGVLAVISGSKIATTILVMGLPVLDAAWVVVERLRAGSRLTVGDRRHLHYRLLSRGFTQRQVVWFMTLAAAVFGLTALVASSRTKLILLAFLVVLASVSLGWIRTGRRSRALRHWLLVATATVVSLAVLLLLHRKPVLAPAPWSSRIVIGETVVIAEIAAIPEARARGLSHRPSLADGAGMLFTFDHAERPGFWMNGMRFPIDIIWINHGAVVEVTPHLQPPQPGAVVPIFRPSVPVTAVLEVPAGFSARHRIAPGTTVRQLTP